MMKQTSTILLTEFAPELSPPGIRRRYEHIKEYFDASNKDYELYILSPDAPVESGKLQRFVKVLRESSSLARLCRGQEVTVLGLGAPHMFLLAIYLQVSSGAFSVHYDACDSWLLQFKVRCRTRKILLIVPAALGVLVAALNRSRLRISYITGRDLRRDKILNGRMQAEVIPPVYPRSLDSLAPINGPIRRVVITADYSAFHNEAGVEALLSAWPTFVADHVDFELHIYGTGWFLPLPPNSENHGWAPNLQDIYDGNTAVYIPNRFGSGIPNKLVEACAARRPILIHDELADSIPDQNIALVFGNGRTVLQALTNLAELPNELNVSQHSS